MVFESNTQYNGVSLNDVLLSDLNNSLLVLLINFSKKSISITAYFEQIFHYFLVQEEHGNFLRFSGLKTTTQPRILQNTGSKFTC